MIKYILSVILVGVGVAIFFTFTDPTYKKISELKDKTASYDDALDNSIMLEKERDKLTAKYNAIDPENLIKIKKFLPDSIDNIRLILEIEKIALPYGMVLKDVKYNPTEKDSAPTSSGTEIVQGGQVAPSAPTDYGSWDLEFSTSGTYNNFINFTKDLESNLRMVDISSVQFLSSSDTKSSPSAPDVYRFNFKIKTYWLKK